MKSSSSKIFKKRKIKLRSSKASSINWKSRSEISRLKSTKKRAKKTVITRDIRKHKTK
jgi:hypothetical protein